MRISVEPESLRAIGFQLEQSGEQLRQIAATLNQAMGSLVMETSIRDTVMNQWQIANRQAEQLYAILTELGRKVHTKAEQFYTVDQQNHSILSGIALSRSPVAMYRSAMMSEAGSILPGYDHEHPAISNPLSAVHAVQAQTGALKVAADVGNGGSASAAWAAMGAGALLVGGVVKNGMNRQGSQHVPVKATRANSFARTGVWGGTRHTLNHAAKNPQVWKFIDPRMKGGGGSQAYAGIMLDTGYPDYPRGSVSRAAAGVLANSGFDISALAGGAAVGAAVGSVVPLASSPMGAMVGLATGMVLSAVSDIEISGKSMKAYVGHMEGSITNARSEKDENGLASRQTFSSVFDSVKAKANGTSKLISHVKAKIGALGKLLS